MPAKCKVKTVSGDETGLQRALTSPECRCCLVPNMQFFKTDGKCVGANGVLAPHLPTSLLPLHQDFFPSTAHTIPHHMIAHPKRFANSPEQPSAWDGNPTSWNGQLSQGSENITQHSSRSGSASRVLATVGAHSCKPSPAARSTSPDSPKVCHTNSKIAHNKLAHLWQGTRWGQFSISSRSPPPSTPAGSRRFLRASYPTRHNQS